MTRPDNTGLWWDDYEAPKGERREHVRLVEVPKTNWLPPTSFPNLRGAKLIGLDVESYDPLLRQKGPGTFRKDNNLIGVSVATEDKAWYFPFAHQYAPQVQLNLNKDTVLKWLRGLVSDRNTDVVGANLLYDLELLRADGVRVAGRCHDVQYAEPLIDETARTYNLDTLARKYVGEGKASDLLYTWCADSYGGKADESQRANMYRTPITLTGPYAEADAMLPFKILTEQRKTLAAEGLEDLFSLECRLIPLLIDMRFKGVRIDTDKATAALVWLREQAAIAQRAIGGVDVWSGDSIARAFDKAGVPYLRTEAGNPSFTKEWLEDNDSPLAQGVAQVRRYEKAANPFVQSYLLGNQVNGRVHCRFHPLRSDTYGAVSGRFSSSDPNLQNIPIRDEVIGKMLRGLFVPAHGCRWRKGDYSQIEYRLFANNAIGRGAVEIRERYNNDPKTDYHELVIETVKRITGIDLARRPAKNLNFGMLYGMGKDKLIRSLGVDIAKGEELYAAYFEAMPCAKDTFKEFQRLAQRRGYIKTVLGRRSRFNVWETDELTGKRQRARTNIALNRRLQGGAADICKKAMVECYEAGVYDATGIPTLQVHDELDWDDEQTPKAEEGFKEAVHRMQTCVKLRVPLYVDMKSGANWGECE